VEQLANTVAHHFIIINIKDWTSLIRSVSRVATVLANVSSVFQLFSFLVVCSGMISTGTPLIRINWYGEPSGYAENPDNWIIF